MKFYAVSDLHGHLEGLDPSGVDAVLIAGDFSVMTGWGATHMAYHADGSMTLLRNVSRLDEEYKVRYEPYIFEL